MDASANSGSVARAANRAWDRGDFEVFDLIAPPGREIDEAIRQMATEAIEAVLSTTNLEQSR